MTSRDFCFWLQGVFEIGNVKEFDAAQTELIRKHLALVFKHEIDPSMGPDAVQKALNEIHAGVPEVPIGTGGTGVAGQAAEVLNHRALRKPTGLTGMETVSSGPTGKRLR